MYDKYDYEVRPYSEMNNNYFFISKNIFILKDSKAIHIYSFLCNKYDFYLEKAEVSYDEISRDTGITRNIISNKLKLLQSLNLIEIKKNKYGANYYEINYIKDISVYNLCEKPPYNIQGLKEKTYYVYMHISKINNEVLYVGKGSEKRAYNLISRNEAYHKFINEIGSNNIDVMLMKSFKNEDKAYEFEKELTLKYKRKNQAKFNIKLGNTNKSIDDFVIEND
ncbi:hypothetical protein QIW52_17715 [Clostridioides difficile]|nr:hypothetical protein [Clostridioides difficile]